VAGRWPPDSSTFDDCQQTKNSTEHPDQARARTKIGNLIASSHDMANTKSQREANASLPKPESSSPRRESGNSSIAWSSNPTLPIFLIGLYVGNRNKQTQSHSRKKEKKGLEF